VKKLRELRELLNEFSGWLDAATLIVGGIVSLGAPRFLKYESTQDVSMVGGLIGIVGGGLWGLYLRKERKVGGWLGIAAGAIGSIVLGVVLLAIADGALPHRYPWLRWAYNLFFTVPELGDTLFAACYAMFWACLASLIRFFPK
jgi:hypothetical protein